MLKERKRPRYEVQPSFPVIAHIRQGEGKPRRIKTIGEGGLGLYVSNKDARLIQLPAVNLSLTIGSTKLEFEGKVHYCQWLPSRSSDPYFLGIEFNQSDPEMQELIRKMIQLSVTKGYLKELQPKRRAG